MPECDLLISSSHCAIKALRPPSGARHLCYLHTPMRYVWSQSQAYFGPGRADPLTRAAALALVPALRRWDAGSNDRVDRFVCNSRYVAAQVQALYRREAGVVHPPVNLERFQATAPRAGPEASAAPYLMVTAFAPYKGVETAIDAFRRLGRPLEVVGEGQLYARLRPRFGGNMSALGALSDAEVTRAYQRCRAFVMPAEEDFGIAALEAQASGRPVIALAKGGVLETVAPLGEAAAPTGVLYPRSEDPASDLVAAIQRFEENETAFSAEAARANAERFSPAAFRQGITDEVARLLGTGSSGVPAGARLHNG